MSMKKGLWLLVIGQLAACGGGGGESASSGSGQSSSTSAATYSISVSISGLAGTGLVLQNNSANDLAVSANGAATFATSVASGQPYNVTVKTQPTADPAQICDVGNASGTIGNAPVSNVAVNCRLGIGRFIYVANRFNDSVSAYSLNAATGALTVVPGSPFTVGRGPVSIRANRDQSYLYIYNSGLDVVTNTTNAPSVSVFSVNASNGSLSEVSGSPYAAGTASSSGGIYIHPSQKFVYVSNFSAGTWYGYAVSSPGGQLTPVPGSPFNVGYGTQSGVFDAAGQYFYAPYYGTASLNSTGGAVAVYSVDTATGSLSLSSSVALNGANPLGTQLLSSGKFLYLNFYSPTLFSRMLAAYSVNPVSGALSVIAGSPYLLSGINPGGPIPHRSEKFIYVVNRGDTVNQGSIGAYAVNETTGQLTTIAGSPFPTGGNTTTGLSRYPDGNFVAAVNSTSASVGIFAVNTTSGVLTLANGSPFSTPGTSPGSLLTDPSGKFAYLIDTAAASMSVFSINVSSGLITVLGNYPTGSAPAGTAIVGLQ